MNQKYVSYLYLVKRNELGVQLLSRDLHSQIFRNVSFPPPTAQVINIAQEHLQTHDLDPTQGSVLPDTSFTLPPLQGVNLLEHFHRIGSYTSETWLHLSKSFAKAHLPPKPDQWDIQSGWTKYHYAEDGSSYSEHVDYPRGEDGKPEQMLVFDVETMPAYHPFAIMACAASRSAWYAWISPWILKESSETDHLVPLGDPAAPKIVIGHNVSYDRIRILEEYNIAPTKSRFIDTMALHVAVKGISSNQRPAWMKHRKSKEKAREQREETLEAVIGMIHEVERRTAMEDNLEKKEEFRRLKQAMEESLPVLQDSGGDIETADDADISVKKWEDLTSANSLADVAKLHCGIIMDKEIRNDFMSLTPTEILENITDYLTYCAGDVQVTHSVFANVLPEFLQRCPHPVSFAGILSMGSSFLTVDEGWNEYLERAEKVYRDLEEGVKNKLKDLAEKARRMAGGGEKWKDDVWLSQLDWTPKVAGKSRGIYPPEQVSSNCIVWYIY